MLKERNSLFSLSFFFKNFWIEEEGRARSIDRWPEEMGGRRCIERVVSRNPCINNNPAGL